MENLPGDWKSQQQRQGQPALAAISCQGVATKPYRDSQSHEATQRITEALRRDENTEWDLKLEDMTSPAVTSLLQPYTGLLRLGICT